MRTRTYESSRPVKYVNPRSTISIGEMTLVVRSAVVQEATWDKMLWNLFHRRRGTGVDPIRTFTSGSFQVVCCASKLKLGLTRNQEGALTLRQTLPAMGRMTVDDSHDLACE